MPFAVHTGGGWGGVLPALYDGMTLTKLHLRSLSAAKLHADSNRLQRTRKETCITAASVPVEARNAYFQNGSQKHYYLSPFERTELDTKYRVFQGG